MGINILENNEIVFFNQIASEYIKKDISLTSKYARKFQLYSLINLYFFYMKKDKLNYIIELGCGSGASSKYLNGKYDHYSGFDYSEAFVEFAKNNYENKNTHFDCCNIKDIFVENNSVEFVFGIGVLHHVSEIDEILQAIKKIGNSSTLFGFIEPQASNPFIQFLRIIRKKVDKNYSKEQVSFTKKRIEELFNYHGFEIKKIIYTGYLSTPFAQVIFKPDWFFLPIVKLVVFIDKMIQNYLNNFLSWNICWIAQKKSE